MKDHEIKNATRLITRMVQQRLGEANPQMVDVIAKEVMNALGEGNSSVGSSSTTGVASLESCAACLGHKNNQARPQAVITCSGHNRKGVIAKISAQIAACGGDIQDVSQSIVGGFFTMIMIVDIESLSATFADFKERILGAAKELGVHAIVMHEEVMKALQRI